MGRHLPHIFARQVSAILFPQCLSPQPPQHLPPLHHNMRCEQSPGGTNAFSNPNANTTSTSALDLRRALSRLTGDERKLLCSSRPRTEHVRATRACYPVQMQQLSACRPSPSRCAELAPHNSYGPAGNNVRLSDDEALQD